jgi:hypothetical protein
LRKEGVRDSVNTVLSTRLKIISDPYFLDFAPFFADLAAFFFAAIRFYIEKGTYISFLIMKIKKIDLIIYFWMIEYYLLLLIQS